MKKHMNYKTLPCYKCICLSVCKGRLASELDKACSKYVSFLKKPTPFYLFLDRWNTIHDYLNVRRGDH